MTLTEAQDLFAYDEWAMKRQFVVLDQLTPEQYTRDLGSSMGGVRGTAVHIVAAQYIWLLRWKGIPTQGLLNDKDIPTMEGLKAQWHTLIHERHEFLRVTPDEILNQPLAFRDTRGNSHNQLLSQQIRHVVNHSTYHRGQITTLLRQLGVIPPASIDLITYYREVQS